MRSLLFLIITVTAISAAGVSRVALIDRSLSPVKLTSTEQFNLASRIELIAAVTALTKLPQTESDSACAVRLGLKKVNRQSIIRWRSETLAKLVANYAAATPSAKIGTLQLPAAIAKESVASANGMLEKSHPVWSKALQKFYNDYWYEQERLAALWPKTSSEIFTFTNCGETNGSEMTDRTFHFTFDDGPTPPNSATDEIIATLKAKQISGTFYILSEKLLIEKKARGADLLKKRYAGMKIGTHGQAHSPYPKLDNPVESVNRSVADIQSVFGVSPITFRPPYGQRTESIAQSIAKSSPIVLWNIDSQDWHSNLSAQQLADRTITLMVLHRRGLVLFHDLYDRSAKAVAIICNSVQGIYWK